ncbi:MAG: LacI family DNA-binding transcriptional regulator [Fimbriimonadaceae bacterium]
MAVTIKEVAQLAGTSPAAVSATLSGRSSNIRVGHATKERIYAAAAQLGYLSNAVARSLATGKTKVVGVMLPYVEAFADHDPFCAQITNGIIQEVIRDQYNVMLYTGGGVQGGSMAAGAVDSRVDGVVLVLPPPNCAVFAKCETRHIPYVSILRAEAPGTYSVNSNDKEGGRLATDHLIKLGHTRIAHLVGTEHISTSPARLSGYSQAMAESGLDLDPRLVVQAGFDWRRGYEATCALLKLPHALRPTAIFAANDLCAEGALRALRESGLSVPNDMAVVGYDDTWFASMTQPALTTVRMPIVEMGALAVRMLVDLVEGRSLGDPHPVLPVSLTVRSSCGATASQSAGSTSPHSQNSINEDTNHAHYS